MLSHMAQSAFLFSAFKASKMSNRNRDRNPSSHAVISLWMVSLWLRGDFTANSNLPLDPSSHPTTKASSKSLPCTLLMTFYIKLISVTSIHLSFFLSYFLCWKRRKVNAEKLNLPTGDSTAPALRLWKSLNIYFSGWVIRGPNSIGAPILKQLVYWLL